MAAGDAPLLIEVPERIETRRLVLRAARAGDGAAVNAAIAASLDHLAPWLPWATTLPTPDESEAMCRRWQAKFRLREDLPFLLLEKSASGAEADLVGALGLHRLDWAVRRFEIGYWCRRDRIGRGYATEAVVALSRMAFDALAARRVEIRMDDDNLASRKVAERAGFTLEGLLRGDSTTPSGAPRSTRVYARVRGIEEPF